jgi:hypothetical protein
MRIPRITVVDRYSHELSDSGRTLPLKLGLVVAGWLWLATAGDLAPASGQAPDGKSDGPAASSSTDPAPDAVSDPLLKTRAVWLAWIMWAAIMFGGVMLLTLVVMWGNRTRRLARSPLPPIAKRDELWFLKPKPPPHDADRTTDSGSDSGL